MRFWSAFLLILFSCGGCNDSIDNGRCLSCHFFLGKKGDDNYVILQENIKTKKMKVVFDSIDNINWQECSVFFQRKKEYIVLSLAGDSLNTTSFQSKEEMFEYCNKNKISAVDRIQSSRGTYEMLGPRIACE